MGVAGGRGREKNSTRRALRVVPDQLAPHHARFATACFHDRRVMHSTERKPPQKNTATQE